VYAQACDRAQRDTPHQYCLEARLTPNTVVFVR
jgi:hypothetical protein